MRLAIRHWFMNISAFKRFAPAAQQVPLEPNSIEFPLPAERAGVAQQRVQADPPASRLGRLTLALGAQSKQYFQILRHGTMPSRSL
jgi:hypothetical protein